LETGKYPTFIFKNIEKQTSQKNVLLNSSKPLDHLVSTKTAPQESTAKYLILKKQIEERRKIHVLLGVSHINGNTSGHTLVFYLDFDPLYTA